jgi:hypothetical protein
VDSQGNLLCGFKEAGLGDVATTSVTCTADVTAVFACINGGGNHPQAANKETVSAEVSGTVEVPVRNGQTTGTVVVGPPSAGDFSCPGGQRLVLAPVSYTNVTLIGVGADTASHPTRAAPSSPSEAEEPGSGLGHRQRCLRSEPGGSGSARPER